MEYRKPTPIGKVEAAKVFEAHNLEEICSTLVRVAFYEPDYEWAQDRCLEFCEHFDDEVKGVAVTCLGHIARIHRRLDMEKVKPVLDTLMRDPIIAGRAADALSDIEIFIR